MADEKPESESMTDAAKRMPASAVELIRQRLGMGPSIESETTPNPDFKLPQPPKPTSYEMPPRPKGLGHTQRPDPTKQ